MKAIACILVYIIMVSFTYKNDSLIKVHSTGSKRGCTILKNSDGSNISVKLTGGANAGTYTATSADPTCSRGYSGTNSFGNQYSVDGKKDKEFSSLQLIVDNYDSAKAGTDQFMVTVSFGKLDEGNSYTISGLDNGVKKGSGKLSIKESGSATIVTLAGTTADGVAITATITCNSVVK